MDKNDLLTPSGGRMGAMQGVYYQMCEKSFMECVQLARDNVEAHPDICQWSKEDWDRDHRILTAAIECIVFAGMCLEAAIYDFAAWHLPEHVVTGIDKMDFVSKWRIIPYLVAGHEIEAGNPTHNALIKLNSLRNRLVHAKSVRMNFGDELAAQINKANQNEQAVRVGYIDALKSIVYASLEFDRISPTILNPLPLFNRPQDTGWIFAPSEYPEQPRDCRRP